MNSINRRSVLLAGLGIAGAGALAGCSASVGGTPSLVSPVGSAVADTDSKRRRSGTERHVKLTATAGMVDLGGTMVNTWSYAGSLPGRQIRITAGDTLVADLANRLPAPASIHWHGVALRNDMDGAPPVTQRAAPAGGSFTYRFVAEEPGTYWFHPHVGVQLDRGLYGALIVEDPKEPLAYDDEWVVVLDDWLDGVTGTPDQALAELRHGMSRGMDSPSGSPGTPGTSGTSGGDSMGNMGGMDGTGGMSGVGMDMGSSGAMSASTSSGTGMGGSMHGMGKKFMLMGATSRLLGGDAGDVTYPYHLINGRIPAAPAVYRGKPGTKVRLRIINAGGDTAYRLALGGHRMTITHTDGYPVHHEDVDALLIGMGERYDVLVTLHDGVFPLVALAEGKNATGLALVRTGSGNIPPASVRPEELSGRILPSARLRAADAAQLASRTPDRILRLELTGSMMNYDWGINGRKFDMNRPAANPLTVKQGERVRLEFVNTTDMWHPMHLHGHTFQVGDTGPRKDTVIVLPKQTVVCDFDADNPGQWLTHCHNVYHGESGMMGLVAYTP
jgi:FtsP/CotA-like multicopper oxidase with cupredoxin domain